jgi:hypothetical protein
VITDLPFVIEPFGPDPVKGRRPVAASTQMWIVSKADLASRAPGSAVPYRHLRIPMMSGHLTLDYDNRGREIVVYLAHHPLVDLPLAITPGDRSHADGAGFQPSAAAPLVVGGEAPGPATFELRRRSRARRLGNSASLCRRPGRLPRHRPQPLRERRKELTGPRPRS